MKKEPILTPKSWNRFVLENIYLFIPILVCILLLILGDWPIAKKILLFNIPIWQILAGVIILIIISFIASFFKAWTERPSKEQLIKKKIQSFDSEKGHEISWEWQTVFYSDFNFSIEHLTLFYCRHNPKERFINADYLLLKCPYCNTLLNPREISSKRHIITSQTESHINRLIEEFKGY